MRLVTRGDLDGLTSAVLITACEPIDEVVLVHPQDITDRRFAVTEDDVMANLPFSPTAAKWFDHHLLTDSNEKPPEDFRGAYALAPSAARVVYDYYRGAHPQIEKWATLVDETDRVDSAQLNLNDVLDPQDYILLGFTLDPRSGLGGYQPYFMELLEALRDKPIAEVMALPSVAERAARLREQDRAFREVTQQRSRLDGNVVFTDFRDLSPLPIGNRFIVYTLFPQANISLRVHWGPSKLHVAATVGHSIFNRTSRTNVGLLMSKLGGGGHRGAGTCLLPAERAEELIAGLIAAMKADG
ncbi:MAG: exopolyphosphatase [Vicinamibacteria bacterium]|nr:exopolyphosphatase [Vicinamibacteria bacterium]